jgi:hypothetical protein
MLGYVLAPNATSRGDISRELVLLRSYLVHGTGERHGGSRIALLSWRRHGRDDVVN